jgi:hypothetical protein
MIHRDPWGQVSYHIRNAPVYLLWLVISVAGIALAVFFIMWILGFMALLVALGNTLWVIGSLTGDGLTIKKNDVVTGHLKWFTYTPVGGKR